MSKKQPIARIATVVWAIGPILTGMMLSVPPANIPLYIGLACIAIVSIIFGSSRYRIFGAVAQACSLMLAVGEHKAGIIHREKMERLRQSWATNAPAKTP